MKDLVVLTLWCLSSTKFWLLPCALVLPYNQYIYIYSPSNLATLVFLKNIKIVTRLESQGDVWASLHKAFISLSILRIVRIPVTQPIREMCECFTHLKWKTSEQTLNSLHISIWMYFKSWLRYLYLLHLKLSSWTFSFYPFTKLNMWNISLYRVYN